MKVKEVTDRGTAKLFLEVNAAMNKSNPAYIRPLDVEIAEVFDKTKNKSFKYGEAKRWILLNDNNEPVGRIAAFTNSKYINKAWKRWMVQSILATVINGGAYWLKEVKSRRYMAWLSIRLIIKS